MCPVREQLKCLGGSCMSLCPGAELTALFRGMTHISNPQNSSSCMAGAHQRPTWTEPSRASCTAVGKQDLARHSSSSCWHQLHVPSARSWQLSHQHGRQLVPNQSHNSVRLGTGCNEQQSLPRERWKISKKLISQIPAQTSWDAQPLCSLPELQNYRMVRIIEWLEGP